MQAAQNLGLRANLCDIHDAYAGPRLLRSVFWHFCGHRPLKLGAFSRQVLEKVIGSNTKVVVVTGIAPLDDKTVMALRRRGCRVYNYLTDDPWNRSHHAPWFFKALRHYDTVFSPRRANLDDLAALQGPKVHYLPFAYAPEVHHPPASVSKEDRAFYQSELTFIGGADADRIPMIQHLADKGIKLALWGGYWPKVPRLQAFAHGHADAETFRKAVTCAELNLCLVRKANRDGHSMRTFELAAVGGCMLVEDTLEHREIFGADDESVVFFKGSEDITDKIRALLADPLKRHKLQKSVYDRITSGTNRYSDRLQTMMQHE